MLKWNKCIGGVVDIVLLPLVSANQGATTACHSYVLNSEATIQGNAMVFRFVAVFPSFDHL